MSNRPDQPKTTPNEKWGGARTGGFRFTHRQGTHDDLAYALALACRAAKTPTEEK
ncbi:MAG: hypothetical protein HYU39_04940 [Thaumarchaeota archaeon]|nr:hypothetical protein [Nitrososphaerota archaeon]